MRACVIIPTYNESKAIGSLVCEISAMGLSVLVVDDGSTDGTARIAEAAGATVLRNARNEGKGASLIKGFRHALGEGVDAVITMDGDGQHLPSDISYFIRVAQYSDSGIFIGNRMSRPLGMPLIRVFTNRLMSWAISRIVHQHIPDTQCGFRLLKKRLLQQLDLVSRKYETESEILIKASRLGFKIESIPIETVYSGAKSQINPVVDTLRFLRFILGVFLSAAKR